jgi:hypothetical protein
MTNDIVDLNNITYQWVIVQLDCKPSLDGLQDYVVTCHWRYNAKYQDVLVDIYGACSFNENPEQDNFIPYEDLQESDVIGWLESTLDISAMQSSLDTQIENVLNPPIVSPPLPWLPKE